ncbi:hypothetical protein BX600DRAFT_447464 [Xylariales sp. PMI_506]|nr:hypothetical protein BX600DRAFT_447464 [Xylariales sp. PMI_506]
MGILLRLSLLLVALAGFGIAQDTSSSTAELNAALGALPSCAFTCLFEAIEASPCSTTNITCQCTDTDLTNAAELCVLETCTVEEALSAKNITQQQICGAPIRDKRLEYNIVSCTLMATACAFVLIRLGYKKFCTSIELGLDDWFILLTLINCAPAAVLNVKMLTGNGLGKDIWTLTPDEITQFALGFWIITLLYFSEVFVLKLSMLFFYLRIFPGRGIRRLILGTVAFDILFGIAFIVTAILQCRPISYNWTNWRGEGGGTCYNISAVAWANAAVSIGLDLFMLAIPLWQLRELKLHWKKKVGVAMMFCVGTFVTVVSVIRLASLVEFHESTNLTWDYWGVALWSTVEITVGIICACMPSMRLILVRLAPKVFDTSRIRPSNYYSSNRGKHSYGRDKSAGASTTDPSDLDTPKKGSGPLSSSSRSSWKPQVRTKTSWRVSSSPQDKLFVDGIHFAKVVPSGFGEDDENRLVPMDHLNNRGIKYTTEVRISGGSSSRDSSPARRR